MSAVGAGCQAVMMAPTQLLAEQHYRNFLRMTASTSVMSTLLTAKVIGAERCGCCARSSVVISRWFSARRR